MQYKTLRRCAGIVIHSISLNGEEALVIYFLQN